jgi:hypothetical protein
MPPRARGEKECVWSNNHLACVNTWGFLRALDQLQALFDDSKNLTMKELTFWNPAATPEMRKMLAMSLAAQLDKMFILALRAQYEDGFDVTKAVQTMAATLTREGKTVCELAAVIDETYAFAGEVK